MPWKVLCFAKQDVSFWHQPKLLILSNISFFQLLGSQEASANLERGFCLVLRYAPAQDLSGCREATKPQKLSSPHQLKSKLPHFSELICSLPQEMRRDMGTLLVSYQTVHSGPLFFKSSSL